VLLPERYPEGGLLKLTAQTVEDLTAGRSVLLGNATRTDPFSVPQINARTCSRRWTVKAPMVLDICTRNR
jgi:hypothetical protein